MKLTFKLKKDADDVYEYLSDMQNFCSVHPIVSRIDKTGNNSYLVHETLRFWSIPFSFIYPITVQKNDHNKTVVIRAVVFKMTKIELNFTISRLETSTLIEEQIAIKSLFPVKFVMYRIFKKQHDLLFRKIDLA